MSHRFEARDLLRAKVDLIPGLWPVLWANSQSITPPDPGAYWIKEEVVGGTSTDAASDGTPGGRWRRHIAQIKLILIGPREQGTKVFEDMADAIEAAVLSQTMTLSTGEPVVAYDVQVTGSHPDSPSDERVRVPVVITYTYTAR